MAIIYKSDHVMTTPPANAPVAPGRPSYRDDFSGGNTADLVGRRTSNEGDLDVGTWGGGANVLAISDGSVVKGSAGSGYVGVPLLGAEGAHVSWLVRKRIETGAAYIDLFRPITGSTNTYRLALGTEICRLEKRVGSNTILTDNFPLADGQTVGIRWVGGVLSLLVDGKPRAHVQDTDLTPGGATGIATSTTGTGFELDNFQVDIY